MTPEERWKILDALGVDGLIVALYGTDDPRRIALLRLNHASENACRRLEDTLGVLQRLLTEPPPYADEELVEETKLLATHFRALASELDKSIPNLMEDRSGRAESARPRVDDRQGHPAREKHPPPRDDDWSDVPF